jgi:hypothetical protein
MEISELEALHKIQQKGNRPIYLGYIKPKSRKRSVGFMDPLKDFTLFKVNETQDPYTNPQAVSRVWNIERFRHEKNYKYMVKLKKPDTGGETYVYVEDVFIQDEKKYQRIKVLYGSQN